MEEYLVRYFTTEILSNETEKYRSRVPHTLIVEGNSRPDAFCAAYDYLTRRGIAVDTRLTSEFSVLNSSTGQTEKEIKLEFTLEDIEDIKKRGIHVDSFIGDAEITSISKYKVYFEGQVPKQ